MAAVQDTDSIAVKTQARRATSLDLLVLLTVAAGYAVTVLVFYPGYSTADAVYVYADAKAWHFGDWQSPAMAVLWRIIDPIAPGSLSMFLLTAGLYWLGFGMLALIAARRSAWLGLVTPLLAFMPPAFFFVGMVWRDVLFAVVWLLAAVLVFAVADRGARLRLPAQAFALLLIAFGVLLRPNAIIAAPLLAAYVLWPARFELKRTAIAFLPMLVLSYALIPLVYYGILDAKRQNPLHSIMVFDLGGTTHFAGENQFPGCMERRSDRAVDRQMLRPGPVGHLLAHGALSVRDEAAGAPRRRDFRHAAAEPAWWHAVSTHPLAYLSHRATFMWQFLARSNLVLRSGIGSSRTRSMATALTSSRWLRCTTRSSHHPVSARALACPGHGGGCVVLAGAVDAGGRLRHRCDGLRRCLRHDLLPGRRGGRLPLCLLVRARNACRAPWQPCLRVPPPDARPDRNSLLSVRAIAPLA